MKRFILTFILFLFALVLMAQVPAGFSYQAVVRNNSGEIVASQTVKFRFSILQNSSTGTSVYVETQSKATNDFGLANLVVGSGTRVSGNFDPAGWETHSHFLKVELDPNNGTSFSHLGTIQLMAVPYAFHAQTVGEIPDNSVTSAKIADGTIVAADLAGNSVTSAKIASNAVTEAKIASGAVTGAKITQAGASTGQALKWDGTTWAPANDETSEGGGGSPTGPAGGDLTGTYPNPTIGAGKVTEVIIADNAVTSAKIVNGTIISADLASNAVTTEKINTEAVTAPKLASMGASSGQILKWNGTTWAPATDETGDGDGNPTGPAGGDLAGTYPDPTIATGAVTSAKIADGTIAAADLASNSVTTAKIADDAVTRAKLSAAGGSDGQVLKLSGGLLTWGTDNTGGLTLPYSGSGSTGEGLDLFYVHNTGTGRSIHAVAESNTAVWGQTTSGFAGVDGRSSSGYGVYGESTTYGIYGKTTGFMGRGVAGEATGTNSIGVFGNALNDNSTGVYGRSPKYGIYGESTGYQGRGVAGEATGTNSIGVRGIALNDNSTGVWGEGKNYDFYANGPGVDYGTGSSIRWKRNIMEIPNPLAKIAALRGVYFDWDEEHGGKHDVGMIAEEVGTVLPEIVIYEENGIDAMGMDYSKIGPLLVEAVKALKAENDELKIRLEKLENIVTNFAENK